MNLPTHPTAAGKPASGKAIDASQRLAGLSADEIAILAEVDKLVKASRIADAENAIRPLFIEQPEQPEVLRVLGLLDHLQGRADQAITMLEQACAVQPNDPLILNHLGALLHQRGRSEDGLALMRRACALNPKLANAWFNLGSALIDDGLAEEGIAKLDRALELEPGHAAAEVNRAHALAGSGKIELAADGFRRALSFHPKMAIAWYSLLDLKTVRIDDKELATLEQLYADPSLTERDRAMAGFALGKALEDRSRYPQAFDVLLGANRIWRRGLQWDLGTFCALMDRFVAAFEHAPEPETANDLGKGVLFLVSLPRSGSTLTEQILSAHPQVSGAGELPDLHAVIEEESRRRGESYPDWVAKSDASDWRRLGETYLERTRKWQGRSFFTDKSLANWPFLGAAAAMLPGARFIECRRDPLETCWSCFKQLFPRSPHPFAYELAELGGYWRAHDRVMKRWRQRYPERIHVQELEQLLADPEPRIRELLAFCGLPFDDACLDHQSNTRRVGTASAAQVRQPLSKNTARAQHYGELLEPLRRALAGAEPVSMTRATETAR